MARAAKALGIVLVLFLATVEYQLYLRSLPPAEFKNYRGISCLSSNDLLSVKMECMAEQASMDAWNRFHIRVPVGVHALPEFERYLGLVSKSDQFKHFSVKDQFAEAMMAGAFVGESIRRTHGGMWLEKSDIPETGPFPLQTSGGTIWPITWCQKRLANGSEDNIYDKYVFCVLKKTNELRGEATYWTNTGANLKPLTNVVFQ